MTAPKHKPALSIEWLTPRVEVIKARRRALPRAQSQFVIGSPRWNEAQDLINNEIDTLRAQVLLMIAFHEIDGDVVEIAQLLATAVTP